VLPTASYGASATVPPIEYVLGYRFRNKVQP